MTRPTEQRRASLRLGRAAVLASPVVAFALVALNGLDPGDPPVLLGELTAVLCVAVGAILIAKVPANPVGWLLWLGGLLLAPSIGLGGLAAALARGDVAPAGVAWSAWIAKVSGTLFIYVVAGFLPLIFPTGRLLSPRWRVVVAIGAIGTTLATLDAMFGPGSPGDYPPGYQDPLLLGGTAGDVLARLDAAQIGGVFIVATVLSVLVRFRRSRGVERLQLRWFVSAICVSVPGLIVAGSLVTATGILGVIDTIAWTVTFVGLCLVPVAIGIAITRHGLYEIDRIVSRTIAYSTVTLVLAGVFVIGILAFQAILSPVTGGSTLAVAASTLMAFALAQPLTRRVRQGVDRRFDRSRYDAERTVAALAARLRDETDLERLSHEIEATVRVSLAPTGVAIWTRER
ncbi:MAG TPA: hypothetical protein VEY67_02835 [Candidatus Dormibacteraeota bacterium]|nr:hypothetical protein [Candidatus Dormibacteraeota bacterium]